MSYLAALAIAASVVGGEPEQNAAQEHLKAWAEAFSGDWISESTVDEDSEPLKQGDKIVAQWSTKWSPDKEALLTNYWAEVNGNPFVTVKGVVGWDSAEEAVVTHWFASRGGSGKIVHTQHEGKWVAKWLMVDLEKKRSTRTETITLVDPKTMKIVRTDRIEDGKRKPDQERIAKRR